MSLQPQFQNHQIGRENLPKVRSIQFVKLSSNYFWSKLITSIIFYCILFLAVTIPTTVMQNEMPDWSINLIYSILIVYILFGFLRVYKTYQKKAYALRQHDIVYKSGWIWKRLTSIPFNRIQHCELNSGPIDRAFDLTQLNIFTAGGSNSDLTIPGLTTIEGRQLKGYILKRINKDEEE